jgi:hypothetical protein
VKTAATILGQKMGWVAPRTCSARTTAVRRLQNVASSTTITMLQQQQQHHQKTFLDEAHEKRFCHSFQ